MCIRWLDRFTFSSTLNLWYTTRNIAAMLLHFNLEYMRLKSGIQFDWNAKRIKIDHYWKTCIMRIFVDVGWFVARTTTISVRERCGNWCYCCWCTVMWKSKSMMECIESIFTFIIMRHAYCITLLYTINKHYTHTNCEWGESQPNISHRRFVNKWSTMHIKYTA